MQTTSTLVKSESGQEFVEEACTITFQGKSFTSGGGWIMRRKDTGKREGMLYAHESEKTVSSWDGSIKYPAHVGHVWRSNMGDTRQSVSFKANGRNFSGVYFKSGSDIVRVREVS